MENRPRHWPGGTRLVRSTKWTLTGSAEGLDMASTSLLILALLACWIALAAARSRRFPSFWATSSLLLPADDSSSPDCKDGVCSIKPKDSNMASQIVDDWKMSGGKTNDTNTSDENQEKINSIVNLGWDKVEATKTLEKFNYNIDEAITHLEETQENDEKLAEKTKELCKIGDWSVESARAALLESKNNVTLANEILIREESMVVNEFESAVKGMLENGWDEIVARQALMAQWSLDQRKARGLNNTVDAQVLKDIKPSLKRSNTTDSPNSGRAKAKSTSGASGTSTDPTPAKKEDCVFEINASNFQKLVLESPVPVLVDIYADWCGPCKQLGPVLENAAMKSGGMFRLAKVNSDKERALSELLEVSGLPTVYAVNKGKIVDKFVGMLPQDQLQQFLVRVITGYGAKVQQENNDDKTLDGLTFKVNNYAGLAALDFKKREKIRSLVDEAILSLDGGYNAETGTFSPGVRTALQYINNAAKDIHNKTFRSVNTTSSVFTERIGSNACALKLLDIAGFKGDATGATLQLVHSNSAVLTLLSQRVVETVQKQKFAKIKEAKVELGGNKSLRRRGTDSVQSAKNTKVDDSDSEDEEIVTEKKGVEAVKVSIKLFDNKSVGRSYKDLSQSLGDVLEDLLAGHQWEYVEIRQPLPRRQFKRESTELSKSLRSIAGDSDNIAVALIKEGSVVTSKSTLKKAKSEVVDAAEKKSKPRKKKGTHTLLSSGILSTKKKKNNEYFGGDSTLTLAGDEEDEENDQNTTKTSLDSKTEEHKEKEDQNEVENEVEKEVASEDDEQ